MGITVAAGTFNPADTIQVVATQGSGETISDEQRSDDFHSCRTSTEPSDYQDLAKWSY